MKYPRIRYEEVGEMYMLLHLFDGTSRGVAFESAEAKAAALAPGRAELDCTAIAKGFLPRGTYLVSRAGALDAERIFSELEPDTPQTERDPLAVVRLRFSQELIVARSEYITRESDGQMRLQAPREARLYEALLEEIARLSPEPG
jgi:hypothetical protein